MKHQSHDTRVGTDINAAYEAALRPAPWPQGSCVYFLTCAGTGAIKIGVTEDLKARVTQIHTIVPYGISEIWHCRGVREDEQRLHKALSEHRLSGEWFAPVVEVTDARKYSRCRRVHPHTVKRFHHPLSISRTSSVGAV